MQLDMGTVLFPALTDISRLEITAGTRGIEAESLGRDNGVDSVTIREDSFEWVDEFGLMVVGDGFETASFNGRNLDDDFNFQDSGYAVFESAFDTYLGNTLSTDLRNFSFTGFDFLDFGELTGPSIHGNVVLSEGSVQFPALDGYGYNERTFVASSFHLIGSEIEVNASGSTSLHSGFESANSDFFLSLIHI